MADLYLTGGEQRKSFLPLEEWHETKKAVVLRIDADTGKVTDRLEYVTSRDACPDDNPGIVFKSAALYGNKLYVCTSTEVIVFELPEFRRVSYVSLPCFNDLHHVRPTPNGTLIVVVTGLDMVVEITPEGQVLREWSATGEDTWVRFSRKIDYRKVPTTKPHRSHPNFAFLVDDDLWITRCDDKDAVSLTTPGKRIDISISFPHDGYIFGGRIWFTTVDGHIVLADPQSLKVERVIDLNTIDNPEGHVLGWCRGLLPVTETLVWVGFTQLRDTKFVEKLRWVNGSSAKSKTTTRIVLYDLSTRRRLREIDLRLHRMDVLFSILATSVIEQADSFSARTAADTCVMQTL
jgi:hypothetical protein